MLTDRSSASSILSWRIHFQSVLWFTFLFKLWPSPRWVTHPLASNETCIVKARSAEVDFDTRNSRVHTSILPQWLGQQLGDIRYIMVRWREYGSLQRKPPVYCFRRRDSSKPRILGSANRGQHLAWVYLLQISRPQYTPGIFLKFNVSSDKPYKSIYHWAFRTLQEEWYVYVIGIPLWKGLCGINGREKGVDELL